MSAIFLCLTLFQSLYAQALLADDWLLISAPTHKEQLIFALKPNADPNKYLGATRSETKCGSVNANDSRICSPKTFRRANAQLSKIIEPIAKSACENRFSNGTIAEVNINEVFYVKVNRESESVFSPIKEDHYAFFLNCRVSEKYCKNNECPSLIPREKE